MKKADIRTLCSITLHAVLAVAWLAATLVFAGDWPQLQHDPQRSGFTAEELEPPFELLPWEIRFQPDRICLNTQPIIWRGRIYIGTFSGAFHCFDALSGAPQWKFQADAAIMHTAGAEKGMVFFGAIDGCLYGLDADKGGLVWKTQTSAPFSAAVLLAESGVFIGNRKGEFFCFDQKTGEIVWRFQAGGPILNTAAYDNGLVYFGAEDMRVYALEAKIGKPAWVSEQLYGQSFRQYHPVVHKGCVIIRSSPAGTPITSIEGLGSAQSPFVWEPGSGFADYIKQNRNIFLDGEAPADMLEAQERIVAYYTEHPHQQDFFVLDAATGKQKYVAPSFNVPRMGGPSSAPAVTINGRIVVPIVFHGSPFSEFDVQKGKIVSLFCGPEETGKDNLIFGGGNGDEYINISCAGRHVFQFHPAECNAHYTGAFDLRARRWINLIHRDSKPMPLFYNDWVRGSAAAIADGHVYHMRYFHLTVRRAANWQEFQKK